MDTAIVLYTRDLRVHDNPALAGACARARQVVPLFVVDWSSDADALLADGDVANNGGNWQWVAGTGNNPRPGRVLRACAPRRPRGSSAWRTPPASPGASR